MYYSDDHPLTCLTLAVGRYAWKRTYCVNPAGYLLITTFGNFCYLGLEYVHG